MGRQKRTYAPGMVVHLTSRLHRREPLFVPRLRDQTVSLIQRVVGRTDAGLLAYAVMPNHLHIVIRQGQAPLAAVMQPLMRRVAHRVQQWHDFEGTVVERRFRDRLCQSADHVREVIMYTHLNPWRAGLCDGGGGYRWTTHKAYLPGSHPGALGIDPSAQRFVLELFAQGARTSRTDRCQDYLSWLDWRRAQDRKAELEDHDWAADSTPNRPSSRHGDEAWTRHFGMAVPGVEPSCWRPDLRDFVAAEIARFANGYTMRELSGSWLPRAAARLRARVIRAAARRGYPTVRIANLFQISPTTVSTAKYAPDRQEGGDEDASGSR